MGDAIADPAAVLAPASNQVERAEAALGRYLAPDASKAAQAASASLALIVAAVRRFRAVQDGLAREQAATPALRDQGYRLHEYDVARAEAETALGAAAEALQSAVGANGASPHLEQAEAALARATMTGSGSVALRSANTERLAQIASHGQTVANRIANGRHAFDIVDEFAESTWSDIRGNGSEAQAAADRAHEHWQLAEQANSMETQNFYAAKESLDAADQELAYVDELIEAILTRLKDLETARDAARALLDEAERSLRDALAFVRANDPDVGQTPEEQMREASAQLAIAQTEAKQAKPDWLRLAAAATAADQLADAALAGARDEAATMAKLRQQAAQLQPLVAGEVSKIAKYIKLHGDDIQPATLDAVRKVIKRFEDANRLLERAEGITEDERRVALQQAVTIYSAAQGESANAYQAAFDDVQRLEGLRTKLNSELGGAQNAIGAAEALSVRVGKRAPVRLHNQLKEVRHKYDRIRLPITGEKKLNQTISLAEELRKEANSIADQLRSYEPPSRTTPGPIIVTSGRGWGGSGSWSSGGSSSGSSWGSMGGGGGSFGGGGGGGSFGGGGGGGGW
ncbi:MAG: hypothetical protein AB4911_07885 [Oscillochloridaceae bacterium umkhey_bin13]